MAKADLQRLFDVAALEEQLDTPTEYGPTKPEAPVPPLGSPSQVEGHELSSLSMFIRNSDKRTLFTFVELEGYPILRITLDGESHDLILNNDQVKLLLRQMTLWLTR